MRHASQLCRGLAEAATRSLERPYIPRHVPLPSPSYSAVTQCSAVQSTAKLSGFDKSSTRTAEVQSGHGSRFANNAEESLQRSASKARNDAEVEPHQEHVQQAARHLPQNQHTDRAQPPELAPPKSSRVSTSTTRQQQPTTSTALTDSQARVRSPTDSRSKSGSKSKPSHKAHTVASFQRSNPRRQDQKGGWQAVKAAYPHLSESQASLLLRTFRQTKALRSHAPSAVLAWYENFVWTTERESQGAERIETSESISLLLRYAYQRQDLRSLLRLESRAARITRHGNPSSSSASTTALLPKESDGVDTEGVSLWPDAGEDPRLLAYNLKVAFAARQGKWTQVDELLNDARLGKTSSAKGSGSSASSARSVSALNVIGWGSLLRYGLGNVQELPIGKIDIASAAANTNLNPLIDPGSMLEEEEIQQEKLRKAAEHEVQVQARLSVTKRLLPDLLRYTNRSGRKSSSRAQPANNDAALEPQTPAWLLESVLAQLARRGEIASILGIVQLALSEESLVVKTDAAQPRRPTHILNLALMACERNHTVQLVETLRIFNSLTGSKLGKSILGNDVIGRPNIDAESQHGLHGGASAMASRNARGDEGNQQEATGDKAEASQLTPNEESLVLILKKVRHRLFRSSWTRKLVDEFEALFPRVKLSGRTFRMIIHKCVLPATRSSSSEALPESPTAAAAAPTQRTIASGRRGRRLRHASPAPAPAPTAPITRTRPPILKQAILLSTLNTIIHRFSSSQLHRSTTNRRRFEITLARARKLLLDKKALHSANLSHSSPGSGWQTHHQHALHQIDTLLHRISQVTRLGRAAEAHRKRQARQNV